MSRKMKQKFGTAFLGTAILCAFIPSILSETGTLLYPTIIFFSFLIFGVCLNFIAVICNGGKMPSQIDPAEEVAIWYELSHGLDNEHCLLHEKTRVPYLCDIIPAHNLPMISGVASIGDIMQLLGLSGLLVYAIGLFIGSFLL